MMRALKVTLFAVLATGCSLDPFFYTRTRSEQYLYPAAGATPEETVTPDRIEPLTIRVDAKISLGAAYVRALAQPPRAYAIFFHGRTDALDKQLARAKRLANLGYDTLIFDYRGFGMSTDLPPTEAGLAEDTRAVLEAMRARVGTTTPLVYYGHSLGVATAIQRAQNDPPAALIGESGYASIEEFKTDSTQLDFASSFVMDDSWPSTKRIKDIHAPLLLLHGLDDDFVRPEFSERLHANANDPKQLILVEHARHGDVPTVMGEAFGTTVQSFVETYVP